MRKLALTGLVALWTLLLMTGSAAAARPPAHERIVQGDYAFVLGWLDEPPVVGLRNAALIELTTATDDQPVAGAEATLTAYIEFGGRSKELVLRPLTDRPGVYVGDFIPTRRGTYTLKIGGSINGQPIDLSNDIEEVTSTDALAFPEPLGSETQAALDELRSEVGTARAFAIAGAALGTIGLVLAGVVLGRLRRRSQ